ncbi:MAG TPA: hypothetical protein EYF98_07915 [Planctomycetes bacterium]|nr:hypothetical protein [Planctomycetota bacterium]
MKNLDDPNETMNPDLVTKKLLRIVKIWPFFVMGIGLGGFALYFGLATDDPRAQSANNRGAWIAALTAYYFLGTIVFHLLLIARNEVSELREEIEALSAAQGAD